MQLRCPHCQRVIGRRDKRGGLGYVLRNRYVRVIPETGQLSLSCPRCAHEILPGQFVVDTTPGDPSSPSSVRERRTG